MTLWRAIVTCSAVLLAGCMPQRLQFYQPIGSAENIAAGCGVPADIAKFSLDERGSELRVSVSHPQDDRRFLEPEPKTPRLSYQFLLAAGTRVRITEPKFVLRSADGNKIGEYSFKSFSLYHDLLSGNVTVRLTSPSEELVGNPEAKDIKWDQYIVSMGLPPTPDRFEIAYPAMVINGVPTPGPVVRYAAADGLFLRRRCFF